MSLGEILLLAYDSRDIRVEDAFNSVMDAAHDCFPSPMDQPPTEAKETSLKFQIA
jgi:hypothetical protein